MGVDPWPPPYPGTAGWPEAMVPARRLGARELAPWLLVSVAGTVAAAVVDLAVTSRSQVNVMPVVVIVAGVNVVVSLGISRAEGLGLSGRRRPGGPLSARQELRSASPRAWRWALWVPPLVLGFGAALLADATPRPEKAFWAALAFTLVSGWRTWWPPILLRLRDSRQTR